MLHVKPMPVAEYERLDIFLPVMAQQQIDQSVVFSGVLQPDEPLPDSIEVGAEADMPLASECADVLDVQ